MTGKNLRNEISRHVMNDPLLKEHFHYYEEMERQQWEEVHGDTQLSFLEIRALQEPDKGGNILMLRLLIFGDNEIQIPNIFLPYPLRGKGLGMRILSIIYELAKEHNYVMLITDMTQSFYNKMLLRGAAHIDIETVQITSKTKLYDVA
ncbi:MAG: hypothetical protein JXQ77_05630 [Campylobacterales bacterium]|nr:hypothetical protein [Campylobacterales bacterium]